jgi:hypothetical protein
MIIMVFNWFWLIMSNIRHPFWLLITCFDPFGLHFVLHYQWRSLNYFVGTYFLFQKIKFVNFIICHFVPLIFSYIHDLLGKMPTNVWFIKKVHNKIQIDKINKLKFLYEIWSMMNYTVEWLWNYHSDDHQNTHPT